MTRETYIRMTSTTRSVLSRLPGGVRLLRVPTLVCAAAYLLTLLLLMLDRDLRLIRVLLVPAACFLICTALRPMIARQRPYDRFDAEPVGRFVRGKGKSMPSRHTASAAAIALAVAYAFSSPVIIALMAALITAFPYELFRLKHCWYVEDPEPTDFYYASARFGSVILSGTALILFILALRAFP